MVCVLLVGDILSFFGCKVTTFCRNMQIFLPKCHYFAFGSRSINVLLKLKKVKKVQKVQPVCTLMKKVVPLQRETN